MGQSRYFENPITISSVSSIVGKKEGDGPLGKLFDIIEPDSMLEQKSWEQAEALFLKNAFKHVLEKGGLQENQLDYAIAGDLMNQSTSCSFGLRDTSIPFYGIFGACSAFGEGLGLASMILGGGFAKRVIVGASSHFCTAEKQFRFPLELGSQRPQTSTWTVTGAGAAILEAGGGGPFVRSITPGRIIDMGIRDMNNMGAAMAPAAADTIASHFKDLNLQPNHYDIVATGDLGHVGSKLLISLLKEQDLDISANHTDCGIQIFDPNTQDTHSGGSGCACSAVTFAALFYPKLKNKELRRILFIPTGALANQLTILQGETIPSIAHAVGMEA